MPRKNDFETLLQESEGFLTKEEKEELQKTYELFFISKSINEFQTMRIYRDIFLEKEKEMHEKIDPEEKELIKEWKKFILFLNQEIVKVKNLFNIDDYNHALALLEQYNNNRIKLNFIPLLSALTRLEPEQILVLDQEVKGGLSYIKIKYLPLLQQGNLDSERIRHETIATIMMHRLSQQYDKEEKSVRKSKILEDLLKIYRIFPSIDIDALDCSPKTKNDIKMSKEETAPYIKAIRSYQIYCDTHPASKDRNQYKKELFVIFNNLYNDVQMKAKLTEALRKTDEENKLLKMAEQVVNKNKKSPIAIDIRKELHRLRGEREIVNLYQAGMNVYQNYCKQEAVPEKREQYKQGLLKLCSAQIAEKMKDYLGDIDKKVNARSVQFSHPLPPLPATAPPKSKSVLKSFSARAEHAAQRIRERMSHPLQNNPRNTHSGMPGNRGK